jgi:hypothetical protein
MAAASPRRHRRADQAAGGEPALARAAKLLKESGVGQAVWGVTAT